MTDNTFEMDLSLQVGKYEVQKLLGKGAQVEVGTSTAAVAPGSEAELGDALLALVAAARENGWDAERALRERLRMLQHAIRDAETARRDDTDRER